MKNILLCLLLFSVTTTQAKFCQVVYISPISPQIQKNDGFYMYENEDMKVVYSFWGEDGVMGFIIYNKTNKPIYIDWKKSALIYNGRQNSYYTNKTTSNFCAYGTVYGLGWASIFNDDIIASSIGVNSVSAIETTVKQERLTFIAPHAFVSNAFYNLLAYLTFFSIHKHKNKPVEINNKEVYEAVPYKSIEFRNFVTYSHTDDFASESYIDNNFSISKVVTMHQDDFGQTDINGKHSNIWAKPTRFYISNIKREDVFDN